jgi:hypothetical protein
MATRSRLTSDMVVQMVTWGILIPVYQVALGRTPG